MLNGLDLFSGIGGITLALSEWVKPVAYCDIEPFSQRVLLSRMLEGKLPRAPIWDDVTTLRGTDLPSVDIIYGGFPCQDISVAGVGKGLEGKRSGLFFEICRLAKELKPTFLFLENVSAITGRGLDVVGKEISEMGYDCRWCCLSASEVGANHRRERWWLLAYSSEFGCNDGCNNREERHVQSSSIGQSSEVQQERNERIVGTSKTCSIFSNTDSEKCSRLSSRETKEVSFFGSSSKHILESEWWSVEPNVGRVVNGLPRRVDRIKSLGNAVVPLCAKEAFKELIGLNFKTQTLKDLFI